jgi:hypothetical protein
VGAIIIAAIITVGVVALLFVVNSRLNRRSRELEDYPKSLLGQTTCGSEADLAGAKGSPHDNLDVPGSARPGERYSSWPSSQAGTPKLSRAEPVCPAHIPIHPPR